MVCSTQASWSGVLCVLLGLLYTGLNVADYKIGSRVKEGSYNRYPHKRFEHFKETELRKPVFIVLHTGIHWIVMNWISFTSNDCKVQLLV